MNNNTECLMNDKDIEKAISNFRKTVSDNTDTDTDTETEQTFWETDIELVDSCGVSPQNIDVTIMPVVNTKIKALMNKYTKMEWLAYLVGDSDTNLITDIVIPKQIVTPVNVFVKKHVNVRVIGVIHSHHDMGNNFSHTDDEYINANHNISLCVSNSGINGQVRVKTDCGKYVLANANVVEWNAGINIDVFLSETETLITVKNYITEKPDEPKENLIPFECKDVDVYVTEYLKHLKAIEVSDLDFNEEEKVEIGFLITLLRSLNTPDFYDIQDIMYSNTLNIEFSDKCIEMVDELDIYHDRLSDEDYRDIRKLQKYLSDITLNWENV